MENAYLLFLQILFPVITGSLLFVQRILRNRKRLEFYVLFCLLISTTLNFLSVFLLKGEIALLRITDSVSLVFRVDKLSVLFSILTSCIFCVVGLYAFRYMKGKVRSRFFYFCYLATFGILQGLFYSGNLITFYLFYEWMTLATVPLVINLYTREAVMAARKYFFYSILGASLSLAGIFLLSDCTKGLSFLPLQILPNENREVVLFAALLFIFGFGTKAGMFPLHGWLPVAHPAAPAPASAILSGIITKAGVLGIIRVVFFVIGPEILRGTYVQYVFLSVSLFTVLMGSVLAYKEKNLKKRLAYSSVSQVSYILFGVALMTKEALAAALLHLVFHAVIKSALFLFSGTMLHKTKEPSVRGLHGIGKLFPATLVCYTCASLALIGVPPFSGFYSKWYLATSALNAPIPLFSILGPVVLLISALLTAGYLLPITADGFYPGKDFRLPDHDAIKKKEVPFFVPFAILSAASLFLGIFSGPVYREIVTIVSSISGIR